MIIFDGMQIIGVALLALFVSIFLVPHWLRSGRAWVQERIADNWCKHDMSLHKTTSVGSKSWYKCKKCGREKLY